MANCNTCGKSFHACSSCGFNNSWEYHYCCETCWKESSEYKDMISRMMLVLDDISPSRLKDLSEIITADSEYCYIFESLIQEQIRAGD